MTRNLISLFTKILEIKDAPNVKIKLVVDMYA